ncbi:MAG TPA: hypothetical protein VL982_03525 [Burkholderiales bacterium]|jgi:hypothetical protein|nr:hypothetical protein [Burkholderiales bacterium]
MNRSTSLIVYGLLTALGPVLVAGFGAIMVQAYGRNAFSELLQWSLVLLLVSIPVGAVLVVAGGVAKLAEYRARRAAGITNRRM